MRKLSIIYGGRSTEHDASIKSYENIIENLDEKKFKIKDSIYVDREGKIFLNEKEITLGNLIDKIENDKVFLINLLHGTEGEDGSWSGIMDIRDIGGSFESVNTSSILMNKKQQEDIVKSRCSDILKTPHTVFCKYNDDIDQIMEQIKNIKTEYVVVKPNNMGASHLTEKLRKDDIDNIKKLINAIHEYDEGVLIQEYIQAEEYTCGIIRKGNEPFALEVINVHTSESFLGHKEKHNKGYTEVAFVNNELTDKIKEISKRLFNIFGVIGMCRFDFLIRGDNIYYLEGNLIPGFSKGSAFPRMLKQSNVDMNEFIEELIKSFENRKVRNKCLKYNIED